MIRAIYFTRFMPTCDAGGGSRRLMQMLELLEDFDCEVVSSARDDRIENKFLARINADRSKNLLARASLFAFPLKMWDESRRSAASRFHKISLQWAKCLRQTKKPDLLFVDDPVYFRPLVAMATRLHIPVIAVCHNLESLVYNQASQRRILNLFNEEVVVLYRCLMTITISHEETLLLNNFGVNAHYLPYYPARPILDRLHAIRTQRAAGKKDGILVIGSVKNAPTREGILRAVAYWQEQQLEKKAGRLLVGGYDSDKLAAKLKDASGVEFLGSLSNEQLDDILCRVRACLCYQERGAGALTKICEMLIAGIPVAANTVAARSYHGMAGVVEFRGLEELQPALERLMGAPENIPAPAPPDNQRLLQIIRNAMSGT
jgi:glycosyltransferase involved in cell wall biosynthesis